MDIFDDGDDDDDDDDNDDDDDVDDDSDDDDYRGVRVSARCQWSDVMMAASSIIAHNTISRLSRLNYFSIGCCIMHEFVCVSAPEIFICCTRFLCF